MEITKPGIYQFSFDQETPVRIDIPSLYKEESRELVSKIRGFGGAQLGFELTIISPEGVISYGVNRLSDVIPKGYQITKTDSDFWTNPIPFK